MLWTYWSLRDNVCEIRARRSGRARSINREKLNAHQVQIELNDPATLRYKIFHPYKKLIQIRKGQPAFHPNAGFKIEEIDSKVFCIKRFCGDQSLWAITNITPAPLRLSMRGRGPEKVMADLITGRQVRTDEVRLAPYQYAWLSAVPSGKPP